MTTTLTRKQREIYEFIVDCIHRRGIPPSLTEIADAFGLNSASGVADHLRALERKGYIHRRPGVSRGIELTDVSERQTPDAVQVPVIGTLPARRRLVIERSGRRHLMFDGRVAQRGSVAVRVRLRGLENHGILYGDYVIAVQGRAPKSGELALVQLRRTTALVEVLPGRRGVRRVDGGEELVEGFEFLGKVVAVLRSMNEQTRRGQP